MLLATVAVQRETGAEFPSYAFAETVAAGKFPRCSISGTLTGREDLVFEFIRRMDRGPYRVPFSNISYSTSAATLIPPPTDTEGEEVPPGLFPASGTANVILTLIYTAREPQPDTPLPEQQP